MYQLVRFCGPFAYLHLKVYRKLSYQLVFIFHPFTYLLRPFVSAQGCISYRRKTCSDQRGYLFVLSWILRNLIICIFFIAEQRNLSFYEHYNLEHFYSTEHLHLNINFTLSMITEINFSSQSGAGAL